MALVGYEIPWESVDGKKITVRVRYFGGEVNTRDEPDSTTGEMKPVTRLRYDVNLKEETRVFRGLTREQVREELKRELDTYADSVGRTPIPQQRDE